MILRCVTIKTEDRDQVCNKGSGRGERGQHLAFLVFQADVCCQHEAVGQVLGHVRVARAVVKHQPLHKPGFALQLVLHVHDLHLRSSPSDNPQSQPLATSALQLVSSFHLGIKRPSSIHRLGSRGCQSPCCITDARSFALCTRYPALVEPRYSANELNR